MNELGTMRVLFTFLISLMVCYGKYAKVGDFPYFAVVEVKNQPFCAGVLLNERLVMVPGHCANVLTVDEIVVVTVGEVEYRDGIKSYIGRRLETPVNADPIYNDVGFFLTKNKIKFNSRVQPLKKINKFSGEPGREFQLVGFTTKNGLPHKMEIFTERNMKFEICYELLSFEGSSKEIGDTDICTEKNPNANRANNFGYLLFSKGGKLIGFPKFISNLDQGPNIYVRLDQYEDLMTEMMKEA